MSKSVMRRYQDRIEELEVENAQLQSLLTYAATGGKGATNENAALRLENRRLRAHIQDIEAIIPMKVASGQRENIEVIQIGDGEPESDRTANTRVGVTILATNNTDPDGPMFSCVLDGVLYPGSLEEFKEQIAPRIMMLISGIPDPDQIAGTLPNGIPFATVGSLLTDLANRWVVGKEPYKERRKEWFERLWPDIERADTNHHWTFKAAQTHFDMVLDRTFNKWDKVQAHKRIVFSNLTRKGAFSQNL